MNLSLQQRISENLRFVQERIGHSALQSGRSAGDVKLIAVSKYATIGDGNVESLIASGCTEFGEARPQQLLEKMRHYSEQYGAEFPIRWHLIGPLQRNKVRKVLPAATLIHSLDSLRLAEAINRIAEEEQLPTVKCLLEVAISQDNTKQGVAPENVLTVLEQLGEYKHISLEGLMGMSGLESGSLEIRREFALLRTTAESARSRGVPENVSLKELSMGMSGDFDIAIEEGATLVRIGAILYG